MIYFQVLFKAIMLTASLINVCQVILHSASICKFEFLSFLFVEVIFSLLYPHAVGSDS